MAKNAEYRNKCKDKILELLTELDSLMRINDSKEAYDDLIFPNKKKLAERLQDEIDCSISTAEQAIDELAGGKKKELNNNRTSKAQIELSKEYGFYILKPKTREKSLVRYCNRFPIIPFVADDQCYIDLGSPTADLVINILKSEFNPADVRFYSITDSLILCISLAPLDQSDIVEKESVYDRVVNTLHDYDFYVSDIYESHNRIEGKTENDVMNENLPNYPENKDFEYNGRIKQRHFPSN